MFTNFSLGLIQGPILKAIDFSPLFDAPNFYAFADYTSILRWNSSLAGIIKDMEKALEPITKWMRNLGHKVNQ
jgi:hypothetical protein